MRNAVTAMLLALALLSGPEPAAAQTEPPAADAAVEATITEATAQVGGQRVRYIQAGSGETTIVLLHGWPQSSHEWRRVMPLLADRFTLVAPDLRGVGGTSAPSDAFDKATLARDVRAFVEAMGPELGTERVVVVGHDIGGMVAYAYARLFPDEVAGVAILDVPLPGIAAWDEVAASPFAWHFDFHAQEPLAERLVLGQQTDYFRYFIDGAAVTASAIPDEDVAVYAEAYGTPESLSAGFEFYRAFDADAEFNRARDERFDVPLLLAGADGGSGPALPVIEEGLRALGAQDVRLAIVEDSGHWVAEEQPEKTAAIIGDFVETLVR